MADDGDGVDQGDPDGRGEAHADRTGGDEAQFGRGGGDESDVHRQSRLFTTEDGSFDESRAREESLPVERGEVIDTDELADYQTYVEGRGIYDERNRVNDLTGREWKFATKSVIPEAYPPDLQHELRSEHGGQKPPRLCAELIGRFSKAGDVVLDPFAGVGGTLLGASLCEHEGTGLREAIGFERTARWIEIYERVLDRENDARRERGEPALAHQDLRHGDCTDLIEAVPDGSIDLLLTDVPYWHMDRLEQTRNVRATRESKLGSFDGTDDEEAGDTVDGPNPDGDSPTDHDAAVRSGDGAGAADGDPDEPDRERETKEAWLADMGRKFARFADAVKPSGYVVVFIGDMYREQSYEFLSADLARAIERNGTLTLKANLVWYDPSKDLHVYGYPFSFVPSMVHQNVLVFRADPD